MTDPLRFSAVAVSTLLLTVNFFQVHSAPLKQTDQRVSEQFSATRTSTSDGQSTVDEEEENRRMAIPDADSDQDDSKTLGPWAIAGVVVAIVVALAVAVIAGVAIDRVRRRRASVNGNELDGEEDPERHRPKKPSRPIKFVSADDDSWRGPPPFEEKIELPDPNREDTSASDGEPEDELTIMEVLKK